MFFFFLYKYVVYSSISLYFSRPRCIGFARRRMGRGGRVILDRISTNMDDLWSNMDYTIYDSEKQSETNNLKKDKNNLVLIKQDSCSVSLNNDSISKQQQQQTENEKLVKERQVISEIISNNLNIRRTSINNCGFNVINNSNRSDELLMQQQQQQHHQISSSPLSTSSTAAAAVTIKQEKLEDFEEKIYYDKLYKNGNNTIMRSVHNSNDDDNYKQLRHTQSSSGVSSSASQLSQMSGVSSIKTSSSHSQQLDSQTFIKTEQMDTTVDNGGGGGSSGIVMDDDLTDNDLLIDNNHYSDDDVDGDNMNDSLLDEINKNWLHFRPKTPSPLSPKSTQLNDDDLLSRLTDQTPISVEIQSLGEQLPTSIFNENNYDNNLFMTNQFTLNDLYFDDLLSQPTTIASTSTTITSSGSGSSTITRIIPPTITTTTSATTTTTTTVPAVTIKQEKMDDEVFDNIPLDDLKTLHTQTNYWNGILNSVDEASSKKVNVNYQLKKNNCTNSGSNSNSGSNNNNINNQQQQQISQSIEMIHNNNDNVGCSAFNVSNLKKDNFFVKHIGGISKPTTITTVPPSTTSTSSTSTVTTIRSGGTTIPFNHDIDQTRSIIFTPFDQSTASASGSSTTTTTTLPTIHNNSVLLQNSIILSHQQQQQLLQQHNQQQQQQHLHHQTLSDGSNMIVISSSPSSSSLTTTQALRKHINGPTDKNGECFLILL